jgi:acyl-coenzyme A thioesterase PaaI-like protein
LNDNSGLDFWAIVEGHVMPPPSARLVNWRFVRLDEAVLHGAFAPTEAFLNPAGFVQGGILAAMLDEAMSPVVAAISREAVFVQTLEMKTSYRWSSWRGTACCRSP